MDIIQARQLIEDKIKKRGYNIVYRKSLTGCVYEKRKECYIPEVKSKKSLYITCHELYHILRNKKTNIKTFINEYQAELFAHRYMRHLKFGVPRNMTRSAKRYIRYKLVKALNRGLIYSKVPNKIIKWSRA